MLGYRGFIDWFSNVPPADEYVTLIARHEPTGALYHVASPRSLKTHDHVNLSPVALVDGEWKRYGARERLAKADLYIMGDVEARRYAELGETHDARMQAAGFTLMELMVAVAVTLILLVAIGQVFRTLSDSVTLGMATSEIVQTGRVITEQLSADADDMIGPGEGGFLVITNQRVTGVPFTEEDFDGFDRRTDQTGEDFDEDPLFERRTDQLAFITRTPDGDPMTPFNQHSYAYSPDAEQVPATTPHARVWYGHALRVQPHDLDPADYLPGFASEEYPFNVYAAEWLLGRNALFLATDIGDSGIFAYEAMNESEIVGAGGSRTFEGLTDLAWQGLTEQANKPEEVQHGLTVVGDEYTGDDLTMLRQHNGGQYAQRALDYSLAPTRLYINDAPVYDPDYGLTYQWWELMQSHAHIATGVTDFIVEFAGDYDNSGHNEGRIDTNTDGTIRWYGMGNVPEGFSLSGEGPIYVVEQDAEGLQFEAFIFRHGPSDATKWPALIRVRYRIMDAGGRMTGSDGFPGRMYEQIIEVQQR